MRATVCPVALFLALLPAAESQTVDHLRLQNARAEARNYRGRAAIHLTPTGEGESLAIVDQPEFGDGTIELALAGAPGPGADTAARGFIGVAFRVQAGARRFELFYVRPTNGRADDQLRRNHSTQYVSFPDWPWQRTRQETPGLYESYADLEPGAWTRVRVVVTGTHAQFYVNGAAQPCLIVNDLKLGEAKGAVALWVGPGTDGYFADLRVLPPTRP